MPFPALAPPPAPPEPPVSATTATDAATATTLAEQGAKLLTAGAPHAAIPLLEAALLMNPNLLGARLDLALAYAQTGEQELARALAAPLLTRPDFPAPLKALFTTATPELPTPNRFQIAWVYSTNRALAPSTATLTLTPQDAPPRELPLDNAHQPGWLLRQTLTVAPHPTMALTVTTDTPSDGAPPTAQRVTATQLLPTPLPLAATWESHRWHGTPLTHQLTLTAPTVPLAPSVAYRHWPGRSRLDGLRLTLAPNRYLTATLDLPRHPDRPGGTRFTVAAATHLEKPLRNQWRAALDLNAEFTADTKHYSPLLENGARRQLAATRLTLTLSPKPNADRWQPYLQLSVEKQWSNLKLFTLSRTEISVGLRIAFR